MGSDESKIKMIIITIITFFVVILHRKLKVLTLNSKKMNSKIWTLNGNDFIKGLLVTVLTAVITGIYQLIQSNQNFLTWTSLKPVCIAAVGAGLAYLLKNFTSNSQGQVATAEPQVIKSQETNGIN